MKILRVAVFALPLAIALASLLAGVVAPADYSKQFRDMPDAACSRQHPLGTDDLGRDRLARVLYGTRVSLFLAPAAALFTTLLAGLIGGVAGFVGGWVLSAVNSVVDLVLSMPWLFLLVTVRALLPLNVSPIISVCITFALLGCLGWAGAARIVSARARDLCRSDIVLLARASGGGGMRLFMRHILPNLTPTLRAQFWIAVPVFILAEANLGVLGLGVSEPLPSWGSLLRELESYTALSSPLHWIPLGLLVLTVGSFQFLLHHEEALA